MEIASALSTLGPWMTDNITDMATTSTPENTSTSFTLNNMAMTYNNTDDPQLSTSFMASYFSIRLLFSGFAIFGNLLTIVAVSNFESLQTSTNYLICSLAVSDMLGGSLTPLNMIHHYVPDGPVFIPVCLIDKALSAISASTNVFSIMWIAVDRYLFIAHGLHYPLWVTRIKTFIVIGLTWFFVVTQGTLLFVFFNRLKIGMVCKFPVFLTALAYSQILLPQMAVLMVVTVILYIAIARIASKQGRAIAALNQPYDTYEAAVNRQQKKIAKMMITVLGTYFACYIPQVISSVILKSSTTTFWLLIEKFTVIIYWANTWLNPIIYAWKSEDFRLAFRKLLGLKPSNAINPAGNN